MKRKQRAHSQPTKRRQQRRRSLKQLEERVGLLLLLLQHNIDKVLDHKRAR